ncbi:MAG: SRPBCC family protein [Myxococcota bacterium]
MKFLKILAIIVAFLVVIFVVVGMLLPAQWEISQSKVMAASPLKIYRKVANLKKWQEWSPWKDVEYGMISTYSGPEEGVGAQWNWVSKDMGNGNLHITKADAAEGIVYQLIMDMNGSTSGLIGEFVFRELNGQTEVTWIDRGEGINFFERWKGFLIGLMMKKQMAYGLEQLNLQVSVEN